MSTEPGPTSSPDPEPPASGSGAAPASDVPALRDVVAAAHRLWPVETQQPWDASGLLAGRPEAPVHRILLAVDAVAPTVEEAVERGADLLLTHHPLLMRGVTTVAADTYKGRMLHELIEHRIGLLACHTTADSATDGVSDVLARACGLTEMRPLVPSAAQPEIGIGRVGELARPVSLRELAGTLAGIVPPTAQGVRVAGEAHRPVRRIAVCGGSGDSLLETVREQAADVYVTADLRHHPASEARETALTGAGAPALIDLSHAASEWLWLPVGARLLEQELRSRGFRVEIEVSRRRTDPWDFRVPSPHQEPQDCWG